MTMTGAQHKSMTWADDAAVLHGRGPVGRGDLSLLDSDLRGMDAAVPHASHFTLVSCGGASGVGEQERPSSSMS